MITKQEVNAHKEKARVDGLPLSEMILLSPRNQALSRQPTAEPIKPLKPTDIIAGDSEGTTPAMEVEEEKLRQALTHFRDLWNDQSVFTFLSKYAFAEELLSTTPPTELLLRFITDRSFYFEQYRALGNLPGAEKHPPAKSITECIDDEEVWCIYEKTPAELLKQGMQRMESEFKGKYSDIVKDFSDKLTSEKTACSNEELWYELAVQVFQQWLNPKPPIVIRHKQLLQSFDEKRKKADLPEPDERIRKMLFDGYRYLIEEHEMVRLMVEQEWLPTNMHGEFYHEADGNYTRLCQEMQRREDLMRRKDNLLNELNGLANRVTSIPDRTPKTFRDLPEQICRVLPEVLDIFETYGRSQLHTARRKEFQEIETRQNCDNRDCNNPELWKKPYTVSICRLLEACWTNDEWDMLTPLFLYHAFTRNSQTVIWNGDIDGRKRKLVKKITIPKTAASIQNMASTTGYRAGVNLVLYQKLHKLFSSQTQVRCLLNRNKDDCSGVPYKDLSVDRRIDIVGCTLKCNSKVRKIRNGPWHHQTIYSKQLVIHKFRNISEKYKKIHKGMSEICSSPDGKINALKLSDVFPKATNVKNKHELCPFIRFGNEWNDFGFYLTTGYSNLYYHSPVDDVVWIPESEIYQEKMEEEEQEQENEKRFPVYRYTSFQVLSNIELLKKQFI